jgi:hypothetical protein
MLQIKSHEAVHEDLTKKENVMTIEVKERGNLTSNSKQDKKELSKQRQEWSKLLKESFNPNAEAINEAVDSVIFKEIDDDTLVSIKDVSAPINLGKNQERGSQGKYADIRDIPVGMINIAKIYQRHVYESAIKKHLNGEPFNKALARPVVVYCRPESAGGDIVAIDGQHTCVMAYLLNGANFPIRVEMHYHTEGLTVEECQKIEAKHFNHLNTHRKNLTAIEILKSGILFGDEDAIRTEQQLINVNLNIQGVGDTGMYGYPVNNITRFKWAHKQYDAKDLQDASKFLVDVDKKYWKKGYIQDSFFAGAAALFKLRNYLNGGLKGQGLEQWLLEHFHSIKEATWKKNTGGSKGHIYFARKVIEYYNQDIDRGIVDGAKIGEAILEKVGLGNPDK